MANRYIIYMKMRMDIHGLRNTKGDKKKKSSPTRKHH